MMTDIEIAQQCRMHPIADIAATAGIDESYLEQYGRYKAKIDPQLLKVAQDCALSNNTVLKISTFVQRKNNGTFFTAELAEELHISFRTAARIVEKLEQNGYIVEIGRSVLNGRGRPTRVFQLLR